jgi:APA family basic amino acid/polyamine antiporter
VSVPLRPRVRLFERRSIESLQSEASAQGLPRSLSALNLVLLGVGCIVGAGIYVLPGVAAAHFAGPGVMISFLIAGAACTFAALCYAELASTMPVSGSAYAYCYAAIGEVFAWLLGWLMLFEYGIAAALLAAGFSGYLVSLTRELGIVIPAEWTTSLVRAVPSEGGTTLVTGASINLVAAVVILAITAILARGVTASAFVNNLLVLLKVTVLGTLIVFGLTAVDPSNWTPLVPANEGGFAFGWQGVVRAAALLFFAYVGFDTVSTAAAEARNPQRDLPIGILGSLAVCTLLYIVVAAVLTGIVPYRELGVPDPIAVAVDRLGMPLLASIVKVGALAGLCSVLLVNAYGQSRVAFAMSRDGLLPPLFSRLSGEVRSPVSGIVVLGAISALAAALLPLSLLGDMTSIGISLAFTIVCLTVIWLRTTRPDLERPFRVPLGGMYVGRVWLGWVPLAGMLLCSGMAVPVVIDVATQASRGQVLPAAIFGTYAACGLAIYACYGLRHSTLRGGAVSPATRECNNAGLDATISDPKSNAG